MLTRQPVSECFERICYGKEKSCLKVDTRAGSATQIQLGLPAEKNVPCVPIPDYMDVAGTKSALLQQAHH